MALILVYFRDPFRDDSFFDNTHPMQTPALLLRVKPLKIHPFMAPFSAPFSDPFLDPPWRSFLAHHGPPKCRPSLTMSILDPLLDPLGPKINPWSDQGRPEISKKEVPRVTFDVLGPSWTRPVLQRGP